MSEGPAGPELSDRRIPELDGLRGLAIAAVVTFHGLPWLPTRVLAEKCIYFTASVGWTGVDLFFVLSGFLITGILLDRGRTGGQLREFYVRRALRIVPAYLVLLSSLAIVAGVGWVHYTGLGPPFLVAALYVSNLYYAFLPASAPVWAPLGVTWSLAIEEQFYLVWPFVVRTCDPGRLARLCVALIGGVAVGRFLLVASGTTTWNVTHYLTLFKIDDLCAGAWLACVMREKDFDPVVFRRRWAPVGAMALLAVLALFLTNSLNRESRVLHTVGFPILAVACASLVALAALKQGSRTTKWLRGKGLRALGRISYGLYLYHQIPNWLFEERFRASPALKAFGLSGNFGESLLRVAFVWGVALVAAALSWRFLERPILRRRGREGSL